MQKVTAYQCEFCSHPKLLLSASSMKKHESKCWLNPARKSCGTCVNLSTRWDGEKEEALWVCLEKVCVPFTVKIEHCLKWEDRGAIFTNEEPRFNRLCERKAS